MDSDEMYKLLERVCCAYQEGLSDVRARRYLAERGVNEETIDRFRIGYSPEPSNFILNKLRREFSLESLREVGVAGSGEQGEYETPVDFDRMHGRIVFPFMDLGCRVIGFSGRTFPTVDESGHVIQDSGKYINSPFTEVFSNRDFFYGLGQARESVRESGTLWAFEGQFDVLLAHQNGLRNSIGLVGTHLTRERICYLTEKFSETEIRACFDGDETGMKAALAAAEKADGLDNVKVFTIISGFDPADIFRIGGKLQANLHRVMW